MKNSPYGSWKSKITTEMVAQAGVSYQEILLDDNTPYWVAMLPDQNATYAIFGLDKSGNKKSRLPSGFSARSLVYSYGGGSATVHKGTFFFTNYSTLYAQTNDQRIYRLREGFQPQPITPLVNQCFGDLTYHEASGHVVAVCQDYTTNSEGDLSIVAIDEEGKREQLTLVSGVDYCSSPAISPDGKWLAWLEWQKPHMPWDVNTLWVAELNADGSLVENSKRCLSQTKEEASFQPLWSKDSEQLFYVCDRTNCWIPCAYNLREKTTKTLSDQLPAQAEFGGPQWSLGISLYDNINKHKLVCAFTKHGKWYLGEINTKKESFKELPIDFEGEEISDISHVKCDGENVYFFGGGPLLPSGLFTYNLKEKTTVRLDGEDAALGEKYLSQPEPLTVNEGELSECYAFYYPLTNPDYQAPESEKPPLLIKTHGGPTAMTTTTLNEEIQYFTSRGFAVVDINYRGSTGYGRKFRLSLYKEWGVFDRDDCVHTAVQLSEAGKIDINRCVARGVSAGGYLTVVQATYTTILAAGCSYSGITNMVLLYEGTHKFEKYYIIELLGTTDEPTDFEESYYNHINTYKLRSLYYVAGISTTPMIFVQGAGDKIVPPDQTEVMVRKLDQQGIPVYEMLFQDEQHGLRKGKNIIEAMEAEYYFYAQILGFTPADELPRIDIKNWNN